MTATHRATAEELRAVGIPPELIGPGDAAAITYGENGEVYVGLFFGGLAKDVAAAAEGDGDA